MNLSSAWVFVLCVCTSACQSLGNPERHRTPPTAWRGDIFQSNTSSITRNGADARAFVEHMDSSLYDYVDDRVLQAPHLTVVSVFVSGPATRPSPSPSPMRTEFSFKDGNSLVRDWAALRSKNPNRALFLLPNVPKTAATVVLRR